MSYLKMMCKYHHDGTHMYYVSKTGKDGIKRYWIPSLHCAMSKDELYWITLDNTIDPFDIAYMEYETEMKRIDALSKRKRKKALKKRQEIHCFNCFNETVYEGWCCEYGFDEYPFKGHECCCYNKEV